MSFDAGNSLTLSTLIAQLTDAGVVVVTSSGNGYETDGATGPCGLPKVQCVGASARSYTSPDWSNWKAGVVQLMGQ